MLKWDYGLISRVPLREKERERQKKKMLKNFK